MLFGKAMGSLRIARIAGIDVFIHWSWLAVFALIVWSLGGSGGLYDEVSDGKWSDAELWGAAVVSAVAFFTSVLLHELSHSLVAKRIGLPVHSITLFIFGGVSSLEKEAENARDEFKVAIVGPLTSFIIGAVSLIAFLIFVLNDAGDSPGGAVCGYLGVVNIAVGIFNMLPGYPLDGGRVLRSIIWARNRNQLKATRWAATSGTVISWLLIGLGVASVLGGGGLGGLWFVVIGWFLRNTSEQAYHQVLLKNTLEGAKVSDVLSTEYVTAPPDVTLADLVREHIIGRGQRVVAIVVADDLLGLVTIEDLRRVAVDEWPSTSAYRVMTPRDKLHIVAPDDPLSAALEAMAEGDVNQLPVIDRERNFRGFVTRADVLRLIQVRSEFGDVQRRTQSRPGMGQEPHPEPNPHH